MLVGWVVIRAIGSHPAAPRSCAPVPHAYADERRDRDEGNHSGDTDPAEETAHADCGDRPDDQREAGAAEDGEHHRPDCREVATVFLHPIIPRYSAQQESFAGSLYLLIATIFSASAIVG